MKQESTIIKTLEVAKSYIELTKQGYSFNQICIELDLSQGTLKKYLEKAEIAVKKQTKIARHAVEKSKEIKDLLEKGANLSEIQTQLKIGHSTLVRIMKISGLKYDKSKTTKFQISEEEAKKMLEMRKEGKTLQEIANVYGVTRERIRQRIAALMPEIVLPGIGTRTIKHCVICDTQLSPKSTKDVCSAHCRNVKNQKFIFVRDDALRIMKYRDEGKTWEEIGVCYGFKKPYLFRIYLQRKIDTILSSEEREKYIRPSGK